MINVGIFGVGNYCSSLVESILADKPDKSSDSISHYEIDEYKNECGILKVSSSYLFKNPLEKMDENDFFAKFEEFIQ